MLHDVQPVFESAAMRRLERVVRTIAPKDVMITLVGESGTGKEVLARRVHELSKRASGPFVPINCAAIPEQLFESELFGHEKGAFTGASERVRGKIEAAAGGTLFLDEIGEMPIGAQAKLLRFLENRRFMRVGGSKKISVDARLVCATLHSLEDEVKAGRFRADLFYRIQGISLMVPPLRDRRADIMPLVRAFVADFADRHDVKPPRIGRAAAAALRSYDWPGNVRELRNVVEMFTLLREGRVVRAVDLPEAVRSSQHSSSAGVATEAMEVRLDRPLDATIDDIVARALELEDGNRSRAARRLGISLRTIQRYAHRLRVAVH
jgi:DNA-binding NtrC family response regulator